jgi:hypothetical protein
VVRTWMVVMGMKGSWSTYGECVYAVWVNKPWGLMLKLVCFLVLIA